MIKSMILWCGDNTKNNERHNRFLENPEKVDIESTTCFGSTFLSREELHMIQDHLLWRCYVQEKAATMFTWYLNLHICWCYASQQQIMYKINIWTYICVWGIGERSYHWTSPSFARTIKDWHQCLLYTKKTFQFAEQWKTRLMRYGGVRESFCRRI